GRSLGPIVACSGYWVLGSAASYALGSLAIGAIALGTAVLVPAGAAAAAPKKTAKKSD
ncbi:hypothetical protein HDU82_001207, partial [Entophlyctis luteolus]